MKFVELVVNTVSEDGSRIPAVKLSLNWKLPSFPDSTTVLPGTQPPAWPCLRSTTRSVVKVVVPFVVLRVPAKMTRSPAAIAELLKIRIVSGLLMRPILYCSEPFRVRVSICPSEMPLIAGSSVRTNKSAESGLRRGRTHAR